MYPDNTKKTLTPRAPTLIIAAAGGGKNVNGIRKYRWKNTTYSAAKKRNEVSLVSSFFTMKYLIDAAI
jgi:hypothetical protein